ncbi:unnamed protein product [Leuciscus chuanchicus]
MEKRSGSAAGSGKRWKFSQILGFLDPFVTPRETTSNMEGVEARIGEDNHLEDQGHPEEQTGDSDRERVIKEPPLLLLSPQSLVPQPLLLNLEANRGRELVTGWSVGGGAATSCAPVTTSDATSNTPASPTATYRRRALPPMPSAFCTEHAASS